MAVEVENCELGISLKRQSGEIYLAVAVLVAQIWPLISIFTSNTALSCTAVITKRRAVMAMLFFVVCVLVVLGHVAHPMFMTMAERLCLFTVMMTVTTGLIGLLLGFEFR